MRTNTPHWVANRSWWSVPVLLWGLVVGTSLVSHLEDIADNSLSIAVEGARNMFRMVVLTRAWNAEHGGVYLPVSDKVAPNPYLEHPRRDLVTTDGTRLTMINPAYMTRLLSELANTQQGVSFHITSLKPIRPGNEPDAWEQKSLLQFEAGLPEIFELVSGGSGKSSQLRYMAPLKVAPSCLGCHAKQGYKTGDIRGGISVSIPFSLMEGASRSARRQSVLSHLGIFALGSILGLVLLEILRRRWLTLDETIFALEAAQANLAESNQHLRHARDVAEAANRTKSQFLANMSHELRTPLNAITGFSHLLKRKLSDPLHVAPLEQIQGASARLLEMINQLLCLAKIDSGELVQTNEDFEAGALADELFEVLSAKAQTKALAVHFDKSGLELPCWVNGNRQHICEIIGHYVSNAVKFSEQGEIRLALRLSRQENGRIRLRLSVKDQGMGIAPAHVPELFALFHQLDAGTTRRHGGNGVGLILCKRLAELMAGEVGVESTLGAGSEFWLEVSLSPGQAVALPPGGAA